MVVGLAAPLSWTIVTSSTCLGTMRCDTADIVVPHAMPTIVESVTASLIALPATVATRSRRRSSELGSGTGTTVTLTPKSAPRRDASDSWGSSGA